MIAITITILSVLLPLLHVTISSGVRTRDSIVHLMLLYALVLDVGVIGFVLGFIPHIFFPDQAADMIGWPRGNPFQFEVGLHDGAWGALGFLCIWIGGSFWTATGLGWSLFMLGASFGHLVQTLREGNFAPYNFLTIFSDGFIGVWLLLLLTLRDRLKRTLKHDA